MDCRETSRGTSREIGVPLILFLTSRNQTFCEFLNRSFHQHYSARASPKLVKTIIEKDTQKQLWTDTTITLNLCVL